MVKKKTLEESMWRELERMPPRQEGDIGRRALLTVTQLLPKCSEESLRVFRNTFSSRLVHYCQLTPSLESSLFIRSVLVAFPNFHSIHSNLISSYLDSLYNATKTTHDVHLRRSCAELWAVGAKTERLHMLLTKLKDLRESQTVSEKAREREEVLLLNMLTMAFTHAGKDVRVGGDALDVLGSLLTREDTRVASLDAVRSLFVSSGWSMAPFAAVAAQSLVALPPSTASLLALRALVNALRASSTMHKHFLAVFTALERPLHEQEYAEAAISLLTDILESSGTSPSIVISSGFLLDARVLMSVQDEVCRWEAVHPGRYTPLIRALLSSGHEGVAPPVRIARAFRGRSAEHELIRALCDVYCRPRTHSLVAARSVLQSDPSPLFLNDNKHVKEDSVGQIEETTDYFPEQPKKKKKGKKKKNAAEKEIPIEEENIQVTKEITSGKRKLSRTERRMKKRRQEQAEKQSRGEIQRNDDDEVIVIEEDARENEEEKEAEPKRERKVVKEQTLPAIIDVPEEQESPTVSAIMDLLDLS